MELPAPARRPKASRRRSGGGRAKNHGALVGTQIKLNISEAIPPSYIDHMPQSACADGISDGRVVQELVYVHPIPVKDRSFECTLKAQIHDLRRKFDARLSAGSTAATTAPESPRTDSDGGGEKRPLDSEGGVVQEPAPTHCFTVEDCTFEHALKAQAAALQRTIDAHLNACSSATDQGAWVSPH